MDGNKAAKRRMGDAQPARRSCKKRIPQNARSLFLIWGLVRVMLERDFFWLLQEDEETEDRQAETVPKEREQRRKEGRTLEKGFR